MTDAKARWRAACAIGLLLGLVAASDVAEAQPSRVLPRIGWLATSSPTESSSGARYIKAFRQGLLELGLSEGANVLIEFRWAEGREERLPGLAAELVRAGVQVIVAPEPPSLRAAAAATRTIPIVTRFSTDPGQTHVVASLARPGGNITGVTSISSELNGKRLELLREIVPSLVRVGLLVNSRNADTVATLQDTRAAAGRLGLEAHNVEIATIRDFDRILPLAREHRLQALVMLRNPLFVGNLRRIIALADRGRLPAMYDERVFVEAGGLLSFGASFDDLNRRLADYVAKILKGARPADLPIQQPTKFELVVNVNTARSLGLTIPPSLLLRADQVIE